MSKIFSTVSINTFRLLNLHDDYNKNVLKMSLDGDHSCVLVKFTISKESDKTTIGIHQKNRIFFKNIAEDYKYSNLRMVVLKLEDVDEVDLNSLPSNCK